MKFFFFFYQFTAIPVDRQVPGAPEASDIVRIPPVMVEVPKKQIKIKISQNG
jgi:hypothetical protein